MNPELIAEKLTTKDIGRSIVYLKETDSTNLHAGRMFKNGELRHGIVIIAGSQSAGRGRMGRYWYSNGGLAMTVVVEIPEKVDNLAPITLTAGAATAVAISELTGKKFDLKYPNDIMHNGKKLGGILSELKIDKNRFVLLGIGINVEQESFPDEIAGIAVSLRQAGLKVAVEDVASAILNQLEPMLDTFMANGFAHIRRYWLEVNCTIGKKITVTQPSGLIKGKAINIDDEGALILETENGTQKALSGDFTVEK